MYARTTHIIFINIFLLLLYELIEEYREIDEYVFLKNTNAKKDAGWLMVKLSFRPRKIYYA